MMRNPDGLGEFYAAHGEVVRAVLRYLSAEKAEESAWAGAEREYSEEQVGLAARRLVRAIENGPDSIKPVGWEEAA
jgi:Arc/MetJ-type ribon-helix-helix transcriptional regulator